MAVFALSGGIAGAGGCSTPSSSPDVSGFSNGTSPTASSAGPTLPPTSAEPDAGVTLSRGNPLCPVDNAAGCSPDNDNYRFAGACIAIADAGDAADELPSASCRIYSSDGGVAPMCSAAVMLTGTDGASCELGADCAPGFDCIYGEKGAKFCRHYCCSGTCKTHLSQSGGGTFCDVQSLVDGQKAPVCMPLKHCKLLGTGECAATESCAVVTESGDTGCVAVGGQQVGASCDVDHCAADLTCLGQPGSRKCYKLCRVSSSDCGAAMVCETSTVFNDPSFGTCQKP